MADYFGTRTGEQIDSAVTEVNEAGDSVVARLYGHGAPTSATSARIGDLYTDIDAKTVYNCVGLENGSVWKRVGYDPTAAEVSYDNSYSGLDAENIQDAIDIIIASNANVPVISITPESIIVGDNTIYKWDLSEYTGTITLTLASTSMLYGAHFFIVCGSGASVTIVGATDVSGDDVADISGTTGNAEISVFDKHVIIKKAD